MLFIDGYNQVSVGAYDYLHITLSYKHAVSEQGSLLQVWKSCIFSQRTAKLTRLPQKCTSGFNDYPNEL